jgi:hypothetical protein
MFATVKKLFSEAWGGTRSTNSGEKNMYASVLPMGNRYGLVSRDGTVFGTYSRARDAVRGATRHNVKLEGVRE